MRKKFDDEWIAKKVFTKLDKKQKSTYSFRNKIGSYKNSLNLFENKTIFKKQTEVVVKITGSSTNLDALKEHLRYITRHGKLESTNSDFNTYNGKDDLKNLFNSFNENFQIPTKSELRDNALKEQREVLHFMFSMKDYEQASTKQIKEAAQKTISEIYPNNYFVIAMHNDTDNPHCHLALKVKDNFGKRINPKKSDLAKIRLTFARELRALNVEAKATINKNNIDEKTCKFINDNEKDNKNHYYKIINYGRAHYKFDINNNESFYVRYRTTRGKDIEIWADDLERVVAENGVKIGDYCRFVITDEKPVIVKFKDKKTNQWYQKTTYKKFWDVSVENKNEKALKPLKKFTPNEYKKIDEPYNKITNFGEANFNFDLENKISFFVEYEDISGKFHTIWGKDLKDIIKNKNLQIGDECIFEIKNKDENGKNIWSIKTPNDKQDFKTYKKSNLNLSKQNIKEKEFY